MDENEKVVGDCSEIVWCDIRHIGKPLCRKGLRGFHNETVTA